MDWRTARILAAAMSWPVIPVCAWLGLYFGGAIGAFIGTAIGIAAYFLGIWKALPKDDELGPGGKSGDTKPPRKDDSES